MWRRLQVKITLTLLALAIFPLGVTTAVLLAINLDTLQESAKSYRMAVASLAQQEVLSHIERAKVELRSVGASLAQQGASIEERQRLVKARLLGGQFVHRISVFDPAGQHIFTLRSADERDTIKRPATIDKSVRHTARSNGVAYLKTVRTGGGKWRQPILIPMFRGEEKRLYGYLWSDVHLGPLSQSMGQVSRRQFGRQPNRVFLIDQTPEIIAHADPAMLGRSVKSRGIIQGMDMGVLRFDVANSAEYDHGGQALLGVLKPIPELRWAVIVEQPRAEAYHAVQNTWRTALAVGAGFALVALLLGVLMGRRLSDPVSSVAAAAKKVARGDFRVRVEARGTDEVGQMAHAFNQMAGGLEQYQITVVEETRIRENLSRYLSAELVQQIIEEKTELKLGGERKDVTVMFADVAAFTPLAEKHQPEHVVSILNEVFSFLTEIVFKHGGTVDKFVGDCVMALFGAPYSHDDDPLRAVRAADEMLRWMKAGNTKWRKELGREIQLGIGIHSGEVVAGNVGSQKRMEYTVIGDSVNIAARLENLALPGQILMTQATALRVSDEFDTVSLGAHHLAGRAAATEVFTLTEETAMDAGVPDDRLNNR